MRFNLILFLISTVLLFQTTSCNGKSNEPSKSTIKYAVDVKNFTKLAISRDIKLFVSQGNECSMIVEIEEDLKERFSVEQAEATLNITMKPGKTFFDSFKCSSNRKRCKVYLTVKELSSINMSAGADIIFNTQLRTPFLKINMSGGCDIYDLQIEAGGLQAQISGGSDIRLSGRVDSMSVNVSGGSDMIATGLELINLSCTLSGGSDARISGKANKMWADASGGCDFNCKDFLLSELVVSLSGGSDAYFAVDSTLSISMSGACEATIVGNPVVVKSDAGSSCDLRFVNKKM